MSKSQRYDMCCKPVGSAPIGSTTKMRPSGGHTKISGSNTSSKAVPVAKLNKHGA